MTSPSNLDDAIDRADRSVKVSRDTWLPYFSARRVDERWVLVNRNGDCARVSDDEYQQLFHPYTSAELIDRLANKNLILTPDSVGSVLPAWQEWNRGLYDGPSLHIVHLTQRCNLTCAYCHSSAISVDAKGKDLSLDNARRVARFIAETPAPNIHIAFQGGEPTLRPDLMATFMDELRSACGPAKEINVGVTTNGTYVDDALLETFKKYNIRAAFSFDGPRDVHDAVRVHEDGSGSFDEAMAARKKIKAQSPDSLAGNLMVITKDSATRIEEIIDQFVALEQFAIRLKPVTRIGRAKVGWDTNGLSFDEYWEMFLKASDYMKRLFSEGTFVVEYQTLSALKKIFGKNNMRDVDMRNPCGLVYGVLNYDIDGKIYACHEGKRQKEFLLGNVSSPMEDILASSRAAKIASSSVLDRNPVCQSCAYLAYCSPCPAHNFQNTRSREMVPYESWECQQTLHLYDHVFSELERDPAYYMAMWRYDLLKSGVLDERIALSGGTFAPRPASAGKCTAVQSSARIQPYSSWPKGTP